MHARSHRRGLPVRSPSEPRRKTTSAPRSPTTVLVSTSSRREPESFPTGTAAPQRHPFQVELPSQRHSLPAPLLSVLKCIPQPRLRPSHRRCCRKPLSTCSLRSELVRRIAFSSPSSTLSPMSPAIRSYLTI